MISEGTSKAYTIFYAAAFSVACTLMARPNSGRARAIAVRESMGFAAVYGHAVADGASPEDARAFARRYAV